MNRQFVTAAFITILATTAGYVISPIEVRFLNSLTDNSLLIGLTYAVGSVAFGIMAVYLGRLSDKYGKGRFVLFGAAVGIIYPLLYASTLNIFQYMGVRIAWAFTGVSTGPILMAHLQKLIKNDNDKAHKMSIIYSLQSIGGAGAMFLGGFLSENFGLVAPYLFLGFSFIFITLAAIKEFGFKFEKTKAVESRTITFGLSYIFSKPQLTYYFIINSVYSLNFGIKYMLYPLIIYRLTSSDLLTGSIMATQGLVAFVILLFIGKVAKKMGVFYMSLATVLILGLSGNVLSLVNSVNVFWIAAGFFAVGEAMWGPVQAILLIENIEDKYRGEILGLDSAFDTIYATIAPFLAGFMMIFIEPQSVLLIYTSLFWLTLTSAVVLRKSIK